MQALRALRRAHPPAIWFAAGMVVLVAVAAVGLVADDRTLIGAPIWAKPLKFALSFVVYSVTLAWLVGQMTRYRRVAWWTVTVIIVASILEMLVIVGQVVRGRQSHFNVSTAFDAQLFSIMGATIGVLYVANLLLAVLLLRSRMADPVSTWAVRLGLAIAVLGMSVGVLMLGPTADQRAAAATGATTVVGAHSVGVTDGGPGIPLLGWSTTGGDLRIGHFIGMHGLQALPLLAILLGGRAARWLPARRRVQLVLLAGATYAGIVALTTWQAMRGQPVTAPDTTTLAAAAGLLLIAGAGTALIVANHRRTAAPSSQPAPDLIDSGAR